jgi:hypothetical protein
MSKLVENLGGGRGVAYLGALVGVTASVAANYAHTFVTPAAYDLPAPWYPSIGVRISAVFWPLALLLALEILIRVPWPTRADAGSTWRWVTYQVIRWGGLTFVALVAAIVSYRHMSGLLHSYYEDGVSVVIGPLAIDGLMVMSAGALLLTRPGLTSGTRTSAPDARVELPSGVSGAQVLDGIELPPGFVPPSASLTPPPESVDDESGLAIVEPPEDEEEEPEFEPEPVLETRVPATPPKPADPAPERTATRAGENGSSARRSEVAGAVLLALQFGPATVRQLVTSTGRRRSAIEYALHHPLVDQVKLDGDRWRLIDETEER